MTRIAFLDSGVGGLTVLNKFFSDELLTEEKSQLKDKSESSQIIYFADSINLPYGDKSSEELTEILKKNLNWIQSRADVVILACNSSSSLLDDSIISQVNLKEIWSLIEVTVNFIKDKHSNVSDVAVFSTQATHNLQGYQKRLMETFPKTRISSVPCSSLVPIIEEEVLLKKNNFGNLAIEQLNKYKACLNSEPELLIYGCSHYPILEEYFKKVFPNTILIDPADAMYSKLKHYSFVAEESSCSSVVTGEKDKFLEKLKALDGYLNCAKYFKNSIKFAEIA
ncbi:MAG: hypothetical protein QNJ31_01895 [Candidatus Caenarcaniphilales bacterium]|nr:hypothetical protein [Candidatus Caenarcaniphilales bacterium]